MNPSTDQTEINEFFNKLVKKYGQDFRALGYNSHESQIVRFAVLSQLDDLNNASILDVGCGFGQFYGYLSQQDINCRYYGIDISKDMITIAKSLYPKVNFEVADFLNFPNTKTFDFVFSSGINNIKTSANVNFTKQLIKKMYAVCNKGIAVNMLSSYAKTRDEQSFYAQPEEIFKYCMQLTDKSVLRHDYKQNDFTIYLYKQK